MDENRTEGRHTLAARLRWAIQRQPSRGRERGLRLFQRRMENHAKEVQGTSLSAIQGYLRGEVDPSLSFVRRAARLLAVRESWLAWGAGAPTEEEEAGRRETPEAQLFRVSTAVYEALGVPTKVEGEAPGQTHERFLESAVWAPTVRQTMLRLFQCRPTWELPTGWTVADPEYSVATWDQAVQDTATAIAAPLRALGIDPARLGTRETADYVSAAALALHLIIYRYVPEWMDPRAPASPQVETEEV